MAWIQSHQQLLNHPKVADLMSLLGWNLDETVGKLHRFWWWCVDYAEDGDLRKHNDNRLAAAAGVLPGEPAKAFVQAMITACWLDRDPYFRVHDWWDYAGPFLQVRYKHKPEQWQAVRDLYDPDKKQNGSKNGSKNSTDKKREDKKKKEPPTPLVSIFPPELDCPAFHSAWADWEQHRRESSHKMTPLAAEKLLKKCVGLGVVRAVAAIEHSIASGYRGIFEDSRPGEKRPRQLVMSSQDWKQAPYSPG